MNKGYRQLKVWQKAHGLVLEIYKITKILPKHELFGITSQIRRASASVPANIAEGYTRQHLKEYCQALNVAKASHAEVEYYLELSYDLNYISNEKYKELMEKHKEVGRLLYGLIKSLRKKISRPLNPLDPRP